MVGKGSKIRDSSWDKEKQTPRGDDSKQDSCKNLWSRKRIEIFGVAMVSHLVFEEQYTYGKNDAAVLLLRLARQISVGRRLPSSKSRYQICRDFRTKEAVT